MNSVKRAKSSRIQRKNKRKIIFLDVSAEPLHNERYLQRGWFVMRRVFEEELKNLHAHFLKMGVLVNAAIHKSIDAFVTHDKELAQQVIDEDAAINKLENDLEIECFELIALQQPVTTDLRKIVTVMKASADLERIGDHAVSIAKSTIKVKGKKHDADIETAIAETALKVMDMVKEVLDAYVVLDVERAREIAARDTEIDAAAKNIYENCIEQMKQDPEIVLGGTNYMRISTYLERIGDYVTNISEWIIYLDSGEVVELNVHHKI